MAKNQTKVKADVEQTKLDKINTSKVNIIINENEFVVPYGIKYNMVVKQPDNALSKMYDEKNELIVNLRIPTNEYRDEDLQELIKWSTLSNFDDGYFRNLALYMKLNEKLERTIVFTHAYIRLNKKINTKADYVDIELIVNQRGDKFVGVVFGEKLEDTLKEAKDRVQNPPTLNIIVPVVVPITEGDGGKKQIVVGYGIRYKLNGDVEWYDYKNFKTKEERDLKAKVAPLSGYEFVKSTEASKNPKNEYVLIKGDENSRSRNIKYKVFHNVATYEKRTVKIKIKKDGKNKQLSDGYLYGGRTYITKMGEFFNEIGYAYSYSSTTNQITINLSGGGKKHIINCLNIDGNKLSVFAIGDACNEVQKDIRGTDVQWNQSNYTATFVLGTFKANQILTYDQLEEFDFYLYPNKTNSSLSDNIRSKRVQEINDTLKRYEITTPERIALFMGNVAKETLKGWFLVENGDKKYGGTDLYAGAGYIQLTTKDNYRSFAKYIYNKSAASNDEIDKTLIMTDGKYEVSKNYEWSCSGWFWRYGGPMKYNLNKYADQKRWDVIIGEINHNQLKYADSKSDYMQSIIDRNKYANEMYKILTGNNFQLPEDKNSILVQREVYKNQFDFRGN